MGLTVWSWREFFSIKINKKKPGSIQLSKLRLRNNTWKKTIYRETLPLKTLKKHIRKLNFQKKTLTWDDSIYSFNVTEFNVIAAVLMIHLGRPFVRMYVNNLAFVCSNNSWSCQCDFVRELQVVHHNRVRLFCVAGALAHRSKYALTYKLSFNEQQN